MSTQTQTPGDGVTPNSETGGVTPPANADRDGVTPSGQSSPTADATRDASADGSRDRDFTPNDRAELTKALKRERQRSAEIETELNRLREAEQARVDASKSELERATERADAAERRVAEMEREALARQVANEAGIPSMWHRLSGADTRALRADAQKLREELGMSSGGLEGGVRSDGVPAQPMSMDDLIRGVGGGSRR